MGSLYAKDVMKGLAPLLLVLARDATSQNRTELPKPHIVFDHPLSSKDRKFSFGVKIPPNTGDKRTAVLTVTCDPGLFCSPEQQIISLSKPNPQPFTAESVHNEDLNSVEIDATLEGEKGATSNEKEFLNLGLEESISSIGTDIPPDLVAGQYFPIHLWLLAGNETKIHPSSTLFLEMSSLDNCAELKSVKPTEDEASKQFGSKVSSIISGGDLEANSTIWARLNRLGKNSCQLNIAVSSAKGILTRPHISLAVKPLWWATLLVCLLGCFLQQVLAWLGDVPRGRWRAIVVKGALAFIFGYMLNYFEVVKFGGTDKNSLLGYGIFSFLVGFWPVRRLWARLDHLSGARVPSQHGNTARTTPSPTENQ